MVSIFILQIIFLAVGIFLGCAMKQHKRAASVAVSILLATYLLSILSGLNESLEFFKYLSPFKYFDAAVLLRESQIDPLYLVLSTVIVVIALAGAYLTYNRRDLYI